MSGASLLFGVSAEKNLQDLNAQQRIAVTCDDRHTMVLAGAGCGKTKTLVARAVHLVQAGVPPADIQILTFTRRAARELLERVGGGGVGLQSGTFHTWCMSLIRRAPSLFGIEQCTVIDADDQEQLLKLMRAKYSDDKLKIPRASALQAFYSFTRNTCRKYSESVVEYFELGSESDELIRAIRDILMEYEQRKRKNNYLDYDDIIQVVAAHLRQSEQVLNWVGSNCRFILVDEMQDTNPLQWQLLEPLSKIATLYCVGDARQSIYKFRGADFGNVSLFNQRLERSQIFHLVENYRSTQEILDLSNWLLNRSDFDYGPALCAYRGPGKKPKLMNFASEIDEAAWVADDLLSRHADGTSFLDCMVLIRSGYAGRAVEASLISRGIPYRFVGGHKIMESAHVRDVLSLVRLMGNFRDELAWMRFLTLHYGVGEKKALSVINKLAGATSFAECVGLVKAEKGMPSTVIHALHGFCDLENPSPKFVFDTSVEALNSILERKYEDQNWAARKRDLHLVSLLAEKHGTILGFLEEYVLNPVSNTEIGDGGAVELVTLTTIHSAKGTEAKVCYVVNVSANAFPMAMACTSPEDVEEERRVLYVALTRAEDELIITRQGYNTRSTQKNFSASEDFIDPIAEYFLNGLPEDLVEEAVSGEVQRLEALATESSSQDIKYGMDFD